jgi:hypothetical protein
LRQSPAATQRKAATTFFVLQLFSGLSAKMPRGQTLQIPVVDETDVIKQIGVRDELHAVPDSGHIRQQVTCQCTTYKLLTTAPELIFFLIKASTVPWCALVPFASRRHQPSTSRPRPGDLLLRCAVPIKPQAGAADLVRTSNFAIATRSSTVAP